MSVAQYTNNIHLGTTTRCALCKHELFLTIKRRDKINFLRFVNPYTISHLCSSAPLISYARSFPIEDAEHHLWVETVELTVVSICQHARQQCTNFTKKQQQQGFLLNGRYKMRRFYSSILQVAYLQNFSQACPTSFTVERRMKFHTDTLWINNLSQLNNDSGLDFVTGSLARS